MTSPSTPDNGGTGGRKHLSRAEFIRNALVEAIAIMLNELGNPPLVERVFPNGWRNADDKGLADLYDLCIRTFAAREKSS